MLLVSVVGILLVFSQLLPASSFTPGRQPSVAPLKQPNSNIRRLLLTWSIQLVALPVWAYTPDPDPLCESLYLICRVQEATCLQERYIQKARPPIRKMKLTLRLVDRSYRLQDQVNLISKFIDDDKIVAAVQIGNQAAESLQDAIDFVNAYKENQDGAPMAASEREFLTAALVDTREQLFAFVGYLKPSAQSKLLEARARVEEENKLNRDEFDPDLVNDAGVFNPVVLPWNNRA